MAYIDWDDEQLAEYGIDRDELEVLIRHLERVAKKLEKMELNLYAQGYSVHIMSNKRLSRDIEDKADRDAVIATVDMYIDGGDW